MSHLSTIIRRVKHKLEVYKGSTEIFSDPIFIQAIRNLEEYQQYWKDFTPDEKRKADELLRIYNLPHLTDQQKVEMLKKVV